MRTFYRRLLFLAIPITLQNLITYGVALADNMMVGRLGDAAVAGLSLGVLFQLLLQLFIGGSNSVMIILSSQYFGRGNMRRVREVISVAARINCSIALPLALAAFFFPEQVLRLFTPDTAVITAGAPYMRAIAPSFLVFAVSQLLVAAFSAVEIVRIGLVNSIVALFANLILNRLLIFGHCGCPALGVRGAAYATLCSRILELCVVLYFARYVDRRLHLRPIYFLRWNREIVRDFLSYGPKIASSHLTYSFAYLARNWAIGQHGHAALTAASIAGILDGALMTAVMALSSAVGIMIAEAVGAGERETAIKYSKWLQAPLLSLGVLMMLSDILLAPLILRFYNLTPETESLTRTFIWIVAFYAIPKTWHNPVIHGVIKSGGAINFVFWLDLSCVFVIIVPAAILCVIFNAPPWVTYALQYSDQLLKCPILLVKWLRFDWMKNLTR